MTTVHDASAPAAHPSLGPVPDGALELPCQALLLAMAAGQPALIDPDTARSVRDTIAGPLPGWFQFRPLWDQIIRQEPDLFE
jgi:hypothetical protein